jgi:hypothetical protein
MKLIRTIEKNKLLVSDWGIYELSEEYQAKYNGKFALSQGVISDFALENIGEDTLIEGLHDYQYEGIFQTELEAFYQVKLLEMQKEIEKLKDAVSEFSNTKIPEWYQVTR